jgi:hypothetical protein
MVGTSIPRYGNSGIGSCADGFVVDVDSVTGGINVGGASCVVGTTTTGPESTGCSPGVLDGNSGGPGSAGTSGTEPLTPGGVGCAPGPRVGTACPAPELRSGAGMFGGAAVAPHDAVNSASATTADKATVRGFGRSALGASVVVAVIGPPGRFSFVV